MHKFYSPYKKDIESLYNIQVGFHPRWLLYFKKFSMYFCTVAEAPTNLEQQQNGRSSIEIRWTAPANPPSQGYRITTIADVSGAY